MRIHNKLFLSWLISSAVLIAIMFATIRWSVDRGMLEYVNTREANQLQLAIVSLAKIYQQSNNWEVFEGNPRKFNEFVNRYNRENNIREIFDRERPPLHNTSSGRPPPPPPPPLRRPPRDERLKYSLFNAQKKKLIGNPDINRQLLLPITVENRTVAWLGLKKREEITENFELQFIENTYRILLIASFALVLLSIAVTFPLARHMVSPIRKIADAVHELSQGSYDTNMDINRSDEFAALAKDINQLGATLKDNEVMRKRWLADTSHELRTPLAILRGEIEAMIDGVRPVNRQQLHSVHQEILHLNHLIDDLHELSSADIGGLRYRKETIDLSALLRQQIEQHSKLTAENDIQLSLSCPPNILFVADARRINQLMDNLLNNSCKYTDGNGSIEITVEKIAGSRMASGVANTDSSENSLLRISVEDSAPGVPDDALEKIFDYLYRVDDSRNRSTGGSGLGLAIAQRIVNAHGGTIFAQHSRLGGVKIIMDFPDSSQPKKGK